MEMAAALAHRTLNPFRGFFIILWAEIVRSFIIMRRYWFAALIGIGMGYGMLMVMVFGLLFASGHESVRELTNNWIGGILGFLIGVFAFGIVGLFTQNIQGMARTGELEQVCLSPFGLVVNFLARSFVSAVSSVLSSAIMLMLVAYTVASDSLHAAPFTTILLLFLTYVNLIGFGYMMGGLTLIFKQVGQVAVIIRFAMIGLAVFATDEMGGWPTAVRYTAHALPVTDAAICLKYTLIQGEKEYVLDSEGERIVLERKAILDAEGNPLFDEEGEAKTRAVYEMRPKSVFLHSSFYFLLLSCVIWLTIGVALFRYMEDWSRDKGTLGAY